MPANATARPEPPRGGPAARILTGSAADSIASLFYREQDRLVTAFERYDGQRAFRRADWQRAELGEGRTCVLEAGGVFERAGVNVSLVGGRQLPPALAATWPHLANATFRATGISMVLHPLNPYAPSFHANFRYFETGADWWYGGGMDLTPMYGFEEDAVHFHRTLRDWCCRHEPARYEKWKAACDEYFTIPHRGEMRGIGGVFFDHLSGDRADPEGAGGMRDRWLRFVEDGLGAILPAYLPILNRRVSLPYGGREREWQLTRRGRYVEFNLVYDKGTLFGLQTQGNIEAILVSMPPLARWAFDSQPEAGTPEDEMRHFLQPRDWCGRDGDVAAIR
jgi:coproporphyrinogen III oxidase